jgi:hypothetical protein
VPLPVTRTVFEPSSWAAHPFHRALSEGQSRRQERKNI